MLKELTFFYENKSARLLWFRHISSHFGDQMEELVRIWLVWELTHSSIATGLVVFTSRMPFWAFAWLTGVIVDRFSKRWIIVSSALFSAFSSLLILILYETNMLTASVFAVFRFITTSTKMLEFPAVVAQLPSLTSPENYQKMNTILDNAKRIARIGGPLLIVLLEEQLHISGLLLTIAFIYSVTAFYGFLLHEKTSTRPQNSNAGIISDLKQAISILVLKPGLLTIFIGFGLYNITYAGVLWVLLPAFVDLQLDQGIGSYGLIVGTFAFGAFIGNLFLGYLHHRNHVSALLLGFLIVGCGFGISSLGASLWWLLICIFFAGFGPPLIDTSIIELMNSKIHVNMQGRVFSIFRYFAEIGLGIGVILAGILEEIFEVTFAMTILGFWVVPLVTILWLAIRPNERELDR